MCALTAESASASDCRLSGDDAHLNALNLAIITQSDSGGAAFRGLYELHKSLYRYISFGYIMRRTGITSKGYLSHVMNGDRRLNPRYHAAICEVFKIKGQAGEYLQRLWQLDDSRQRDRRSALLAAQYVLKASASMSQAI